MTEVEHFKVVGDYAVFRPAGRVTLEQAVQSISDAIAFSCEQGIKKLLADITGLHGFAPPGVGARYFFIRDWARIASGQVSIAIVARAEMIDSEKIGVTMAQNAGLHGNVFDSEEEALTWLNGAPTQAQEV